MIVFILANIADHDEMLHYVAFHCVFHVCQSLVYLISYQRHCIVVLSKTHLSELSTGQTQEGPSLFN